MAIFQYEVNFHFYIVRIMLAILVTNGFMILLYTVEFQEQNV